VVILSLWVGTGGDHPTLGCVVFAEVEPHETPTKTPYQVVRSKSEANRRARDRLKLLAALFVASTLAGLLLFGVILGG
jgi:hypothetical protein